MGGSADAIRGLVESPLTSAGLELWDVEVTRDTVRILVDRSGGIDLDTLATLAGQVVSPLLDEHADLTPDDHFALEVSSPGVERTLRTVDHYQRYVGQQVSVKTAIPIDGSRRHQGVLQSADDQAITVTTDGAEVTIPLRDVERARTVLVWGAAPKPGKPGAKKTSASSTQAVKRPAATGRVSAGTPVASKEKDTE
jgi:ribosome maturation factor RimP